MKATVIKGEKGRITVRIRRGGTVGELYRLHADLKPGDVVNVIRQANNPYLVRHTGS